MFDIVAELNRINRQHHAIMGYPPPVPLKPLLGFEIPESIRKGTDRDTEPHDEHNRQPQA